MNIKTLITVPISVGELFDKITILQIKDRRLSNPEQLEAVRQELSELTQIAFLLQADDEAVRLFEYLKSVNEMLWETEDEIRTSLHRGGHQLRCVGLIGIIHRKNDERARIKKAINELFKSQIVEVKKYATQDEV